MCMTRFGESPEASLASRNVCTSMGVSLATGMRPNPGMRWSETMSS